MREDRFDSSLEILLPKARGGKKCVWSMRSVHMDPEGLVITQLTATAGLTETRYAIEDIMMFGMARQDDVIHAKQAELPLIFQVQVVQSGESEGLSVAGPRPHQVEPDGTLKFRGHHFELRQGERGCQVADCRIKASIISRAKAYACRNGGCDYVCHKEHIVTNSLSVKKCLRGGFDVTRLTFKAASADTCRAWLEKLKALKSEVRDRKFGLDLVDAASELRRAVAESSPLRK